MHIGNGLKEDLLKTQFNQGGMLLSYYSYQCPKCNVIIIEKPFGTAKENEICPYCKSEAKRIFSATPSIWKTDGAFGKSSKR